MSTIALSPPNSHKGRRNHGRTEQERIREGEQILRARNAGVEISELMAQTGLSRVSVYRRLNQALDARLSLTVDEYRAAQDEVLDNLMARHEQGLERVELIFDRALSRQVPDERSGVMVSAPDFDLAERMLFRRTQILDSILRVAERRARLHGLDRPAEVNVQVTEVTQADQELAAMIRQAKAQAASAEERLRESSD